LKQQISVNRIFYNLDRTLRYFYRTYLNIGHFCSIGFPETHQRSTAVALTCISSLKKSSFLGFYLIFHTYSWST